MASFIYTSFFTKLLNGAGINLAGDTIKVALLKSTYTPSKAHSSYSDISSQEVSNGSGYTTGGASLASKTVTEDDVNFNAIWDAADPTWPNSSITARYGAIYKSTGVAGTSYLIALIDFGQDLSTNDSTFSIAFNVAGILKLLAG